MSSIRSRSSCHDLFAATVDADALLTIPDAAHGGPLSHRTFGHRTVSRIDDGRGAGRCSGSGESERRHAVVKGQVGLEAYHRALADLDPMTS